jgi:hypothetical protein
MAVSEIYQRQGTLEITESIATELTNEARHGGFSNWPASVGRARSVGPGRSASLGFKSPQDPKPIFGLAEGGWGYEGKRGNKPMHCGNYLG